MPYVTITCKALVIDTDGRAALRKAKDAARKRAAGKCITKWCRNWLPRSARQKYNCHCSKCSMLRWRFNDPIHCVVSRLRDRARRKGVPFNLTVEGMEEFLKDSGYLERKGRAIGSLHIDRIKPSLGYVWGNIQLITAHENLVKGAREEEGDPF